MRLRHARERRRVSLGGGLLVEELAGLLDTSLQKTEVLHDELNVVNGKINEHTRDLGSLVWAGDLLDEVEEASSDLLLVVGVLGHNSVDELLTRNQVTLLQCHLCADLRWLRRGLGYGLWLLAAHHLVLSCHHLWVHLHVRGSHGLGIAVHVLTVVHPVVVAIVLTHGTTWSVLEVTWATWHLATHSWRSACTSHQHGHLVKKHFQVELDLLLVGELGPLSLVRVLLTEGLEVLLVKSGLVLQLTDLLDLVVVDRQRLVIDREVLFG